MPLMTGSGLACFLAHPTGARVLGTSTIPEFKVLFLLGGGLIALASLVRWLYPLGESGAPKSMEVMMWISPAEITEQLAGRK
jgi:hypothetical protein